jgi:hypothetical protein
MTRDDLNELQALAASISEEAHGWRAHRRQRAVAHAQKRAAEEIEAPGRRRRRHRLIASASVGVIAVAATVLVVTHHPSQPAPAPKRTIVTVRHLPAPVRAGQEAALQLTQQGRIPNIFACQSLYESQRLAAVPGQQGGGWRMDYLDACAHAPVPNPTAG